jgi:hypothetical protein
MPVESVWPHATPGDTGNLEKLQHDEGYMSFFQRHLHAPNNRPTMSDLADQIAASLSAALLPAGVCVCVRVCVCERVHMAHAGCSLLISVLVSRLRLHVSSRHSLTGERSCTRITHTYARAHSGASAVEADASAAAAAASREESARGLGGGVLLSEMVQLMDEFQDSVEVGYEDAREVGEDGSGTGASGGEGMDVGRGKGDLGGIGGGGDEDASGMGERECVGERQIEADAKVREGYELMSKMVQDDELNGLLHEQLHEWFYSETKDEHDNGLTAAEQARRMRVSEGLRWEWGTRIGRYVAFCLDGQHLVPSALVTSAPPPLSLRLIVDAITDPKASVLSASSKCVLAQVLCPACLLLGCMS